MMKKYQVNENVIRKHKHEIVSKSTSNNQSINHKPIEL